MKPVSCGYESLFSKSVMLLRGASSLILSRRIIDLSATKTNNSRCGVNKSNARLLGPNVRCWSQQRGDRGYGSAVWALLRQIMCVVTHPFSLPRLPHHHHPSGQYETSGRAEGWNWRDAAVTGPCNRTIEEGVDTHTHTHSHFCML